MRTTLNIDDDVLRAAKELARLRGTSAGEVISKLARQTLMAESPPDGIRNGVPLLSPREGERIVTPDDVIALADEDSLPRADS